LIILFSRASRSSFKYFILPSMFTNVESWKPDGVRLKTLECTWKSLHGRGYMLLMVFGGWLFNNLEHRRNFFQLGSPPFHKSSCFFLP
jgi:hypothetical protein